MQRVQFLAIGELLADLITADYIADISQARGFHLHAGGSPANVCANLKWLGVASALVSCVGDDSLGNFLVEEIKKSGITTEHITRSKTHPTSLVLVSRSNATPDFIAYRSADAQLGEVDVALLRNASIIHTCAFALSRNPAQQHILDALSWAVSNGKTISVDWNFAPGIWTSDGNDIFNQICAMRPLLKISIDDISRFCGRTMSIGEARDLLSALDVEVICLTCGKEGVWFKQGKEPWSFEPAIHVNDVVDTTGAGDAFWAGFIFCYLQGKTLNEAVVRGITIAAKKVQTMGPLYSHPISILAQSTSKEA